MVAFHIDEFLYDETCFREYWAVAWRGDQPAVAVEVNGGTYTAEGLREQFGLSQPDWSRVRRHLSERGQVVYGYPPSCFPVFWRTERAGWYSARRLEELQVEAGRRTAQAATEDSPERKLLREHDQRVQLGELAAAIVGLDPNHPNWLVLVLSLNRWLRSMPSRPDGFAWTRLLRQKLITAGGVVDDTRLMRLLEEGQLPDLSDGCPAAVEAARPGFLGRIPLSFLSSDPSTKQS